MIAATYNGHNLNEYADEGGIWLVGVSDRIGDRVRHFFQADPSEIRCVPVNRSIETMIERRGRMLVFFDTKNANSADEMIVRQFVFERGGAFEYAGPFIDCTIGGETVRPDLRYLSLGRLDYIDRDFKHIPEQPTVRVDRDLFVDLLKLAREALQNPDAPTIKPDALAPATVTSPEK